MEEVSSAAAVKIGTTGSRSKSSHMDCASREHGDDLASAASHHQHSINAVGQYL